MCCRIVLLVLCFDLVVLETEDMFFSYELAGH